MAAMCSFVSIKMFIWFFVLGSVLSAPADDFEVLSNDAELGVINEKYAMHIVPGAPANGYSPQKPQKQKLFLSDVVGTENEHYQQFIRSVKRGHAMKGLTFNIYDDNMRDAAVSLYRLLCSIKEDDDFSKVKEWAKLNINDDMFEYAWRLVSLYDGKFGAKETEPLFNFKPNYFVNSETIMKALRLKDGSFNLQEAKVNQYYLTTKDYNVISINTNYSNWNSINDNLNEKIDYFTEDISLNSYYYGVQLLHPFWMSNNELDEINPRHAEQYYFVHQQLIARYLLEKEHFKSQVFFGSDHKDYNPQLTYDNGLQFPVQPRAKINNEWSENLVQISSMYTAIKECISRGIIFMDNGTVIKMTDDNYVELITKLIRANFDGIKTAKIIRSIYGFGPSGYNLDEYNPAPSLLHHAETSLRDPVYWDMMQYMLNHYNDYRNLMDPYDLKKYETEEFCIQDFNATKVTTIFDYYEFPINHAVDKYNLMSPRLVITARQRRLTHLPFSIDFLVESVKEKEVVVRIFLGPRYASYDECWLNYDKFYQLDAYILKLKSGTNLISWSSDQSTRLSFDESFNGPDSSKQMNYNIFKFPENLLIPKGLEGGLNLTLFTIITPAEDSIAKLDSNSNSPVYSSVSVEVDNKPLGFPFHRQATGYSESACNYKFINVTVYHKRWPLDDTGFFSPHLY